MLRRRLRSRRVVVRDVSMRPSLAPGDRLWVERTPIDSGRLRRGAIVVVRDPEDRRRRLIKRVVGLPGDPLGPRPVPGDDGRVPPGHVFLLSDAPDQGRDSRRFGAVPLELVVGEAWFRYAPPDRRGPLGP